jgi:hypothetical protein
VITAGLALVVLGAAAVYAVSTAGRLEPAALAGGAIGIVLLAVGITLRWPATVPWAVP